MTTLKEIKAPIREEMESFEKKFKAAMSTKVPLLDKITYYIVKRKGKQLRPMLVFLSARLFAPIEESTYRAASLVELMHTATLVHDDVVDDANMRRGFFSINALWKNKIAVLVGDFLLSKSLLLSVDHNEYRLLQIVSNAVKEMSEGELLQIQKARKLDIKEPIYFDIIRQKTASLIASCCESGAASVKTDEAHVKKMHQFGEWIGMAFQIKDDLFDYQHSNKTGKPTGIDIKEQKMTLPLIYALQHADKKNKRFIINTVKNHNNNPARVREVVDYVNQSGGIEYAHEKMMEYRNKALALLDDFEDGEAKEALKKLVDYVVERKK